MERLRQRGFGDQVVARVVQDLSSRGLVDDQAFALNWARARVLTRCMGRRRLAEELREKGVPKEVVEVAIREAFQETGEEAVARGAAEKRLKALRHLPTSVARRRLAGYLLRRGFSSEMVRRLVTTLVKKGP